MSADNRHRTTNARALPRKDTNDEAYTTPSTATHRTRQCKDATERVSPTTTIATTKNCGVITQDTSANDKPEKESVDHSKTEALAEKIDRHLTTTLHGEFFEGTKSSNATRHKQMPEIFALRAEIQELKAAIEKKDRYGNDSQEPSEAKNSSKHNANMLAVIKNVVAEQLDKKLRDMRIENQRLNERVDKSEKEKAELETKVISIEAKARKSERPGCTQMQYLAMQARLGALEKESKRTPCTAEEYQALLRRVAEMEAVARSASTIVSQEKERLSALEVKVDATEGGVSSPQEQFWSHQDVQNETAKLAEEAQSQYTKITERLDDQEERTTRIYKHVDGHSGRLVKVERRGREDKERLEGHDSRLEVLEDYAREDDERLDEQDKKLSRIESQKIPANIKSIQELDERITKAAENSHEWNTYLQNELAVCRDSSVRKPQSDGNPRPRNWNRRR